MVANTFVATVVVTVRETVTLTLIVRHRQPVCEMGYLQHWARAALDSRRFALQSARLA